MQDFERNFKYVRITNLNRISGTPSNFVMDLSNETNLHNSRSVWIDKVTVPNVFYNIDSHNNRLDFTATNLGGAPSLTTSVTVTPGFYSTTQLMAELKILMDLALVPVTGTITFTQNPNTNLVSFTTTGLDDITIQVYNSPDESTLSPFIGNVTQLSPSTLGTFSAMPTLSGESMIYLHSKDINLGNTVISTVGSDNASNTNRNVSAFCSIPVRVPFLGNIHYESTGSPSDNIKLDGTKDLANINIKLRARDGRILNLSDNQELTIVLKVFY